MGQSCNVDEASDEMPFRGHKHMLVRNNVRDKIPFCGYKHEVEKLLSGEEMSFVGTSTRAITMRQLVQWAARPVMK